MIKVLLGDGRPEDKGNKVTHTHTGKRGRTYRLRLNDTESF